jgi:hypothetical protein
MIANISQKINVQSVALALSLLTLVFEIFFFNMGIVSTLAFILYISLVGISIGERFFDTRGLQWWGGIALLLSSTSLLGVLIYYPYKLTAEISLITIVLPLILLLKKRQKIVSDTEPDTPPLPLSAKAGIATFFILEAILLTTIVSARSGELMRSPWLAFDAWFFILFALTTSSLCFLATKKINPKILLAGSIIHFLIFYSIAAIIHKLGFGFDGFIHRATESWILEHGFIFPKEPFYIGQYGLVVTLSRLSGITINYIDIFLVPILAALSIPTLLYHTLPKAWNMTKQVALTLALLVPFIFFLSFNLTTPHNLALLLLVLSTISIIGYTANTIPYILPLSLVLTALGTHPLLGVPALVIILAVYGIKKYSEKKIYHTIYASTLIVLATLPLIMFSLQQWMGGYGLPTLVNPFSNIDLFLEFFKRPFWYKTSAIWYLEIIYIWQYLLAGVVILLALFGVWFQRKSRIAWLLLSSSIGLGIGAFLLRTLITFPNVASSEQGNYPLRLLVGAVAILIPSAMYGAYILGKEKMEFVRKKIKLNLNTYQLIGSIKIGILLMLSLYFAYPQVNQKVYFPGFNVTEYDKAAVEWIHEQNESYDYVVLSSILTAVTALTEHPFASYIDTTLGPQFYYSIPSGGPLYLAYEEMVYQGQKRETIDKIFELTNVRKVYFVIPWYWSNVSGIIDGAKKSADSWHSIDDKMMIFEYTRSDN